MWACRSMRRRADRAKPGTEPAPARGRRRADPILGGGRLDKRVGLMIALFPLLIAAIVGYSARETSKVARDIRVISLAGGQRALAERYIKDVLLLADGRQADPSADASQLSENAWTLLHGDAAQPQGDGQEPPLAPAISDQRVVAKLEQESKLIDSLVAKGDRLLRTPRSTPGYTDQILDLRVVGAQVSSVTNDAVGEMTNEEQDTVHHLVLVELIAGFLGAAVAFAVAIRLRRTAEGQADRFRALVENSSDMITVLDSVGVIRYQSPAAERILGYRPEALVGRKMSELIHPEDADALEALSGGVVPEEAAATYACRLRHADGSWRHIEAAAQWSGDAVLGGLVLNSRDVTERVELGDELRRAQEARVSELQETANRLRALDDMKNAILSAVSHELRTPLTSVLGYGVTLQRAEEGEIQVPAEDRLEFLTNLVRNARKLDRLLEELLDLDRLSRGVIRPRLQHQDVAALVRRVVAEFEFPADRPVHVDVQRVSLPIDGPKVERIIENLLANAVKYAPPGTPIWVKLRPASEGALLTVDDMGQGLPAQDRVAIFEPFRQGSNRNAHAPGVGIGLSLVAKYAELHGGRAWVEDRPGGGSSFRVLLCDPAGAEGVREAG
jgi:PAS domain S-box-containing protein